MRLPDRAVLIPDELVGLAHNVSAKEVSVDILLTADLVETLEDNTYYRFVLLPEDLIEVD